MQPFAAYSLSQLIELFADLTVIPEAGSDEYFYVFTFLSV